MALLRLAYRCEQQPRMKPVATADMCVHRYSSSSGLQRGGRQHVYLCVCLGGGGVLGRVGFLLGGTVTAHTTVSGHPDEGVHC